MVSIHCNRSIQFPSFWDKITDTVGTILTVFDVYFWHAIMSLLIVYLQCYFILFVVILPSVSSSCFQYKLYFKSNSCISDSVASDIWLMRHCLLWNIFDEADSFAKHAVQHFFILDINWLGKSGFLNSLFPELRRYSMIYCIGLIQHCCSVSKLSKSFLLRRWLFSTIVRSHYFEFHGAAVFLSLGFRLQWIRFPPSWQWQLP